MGISSGGITGPISEKEQLQITEALLEALAKRDGILYERPPDEILPEASVRRPGVETGG